MNTDSQKEKRNEKWDKISAKLMGTANWVVRLTGGAILFVLVWYSMRFTQYMVPMQGYEYPVDTKDSVLWNLLTLAAAIGLFAAGFALEGRVEERIQKWIRRGAAGIAMLWQGAWGFLWISSADRPPTGDQGNVFTAASGYLTGDYYSLGPNGYCEIYPHQLGLASLEELVFRICGKADYHVLQVILLAMITGEIYFIYGILKELAEHTTVVVLGTLFAGFCMLTVFYSSWIYGEVPFVFFSLLAAWMLARYIKRGSFASLAGFAAAVIFDVLVRKNALILVVAFGLIGVVYALAERNKKVAVAVLLAVLLPNLCYSGIYKMYELRSGYVHAEGMPANGYIHIGLMETEGRYGWDYLDSSRPYYDSGRNTDKTREVYRERIGERLREMAGRPEYMIHFFKGKVLSQWNAPLYQSMYFNYVHEEVYNAPVTAFFDRLSEDMFDGLLWTADRLQFVIYVGSLLYYILRVKRDSNLLQHLLAVTVIGGFLFSILWEAKTRYVFPYYMMMFPMAAMGYGELCKTLRKKSGGEGKLRT